MDNEFKYPSLVPACDNDFSFVIELSGNMVIFASVKDTRMYGFHVGGKAYVRLHVASVATGIGNLSLTQCYTGEGGVLVVLFVERT